MMLGTLWLPTFLHYILHGDHSEVPKNTIIEIMFRIVDSLNILRGFFMFIILVCKKNVLRKLRLRLMGSSTNQFNMQISQDIQMSDIQRYGDEQPGILIDEETCFNL